MHFNLTRTAHLYALKNVESVTRCESSVAHKIRAERARGNRTLPPRLPASPEARIGTLMHELFHISPRFDGTLDEQHRHARIGADFAKALRPIVRRYLNRCPEELWAPFAYTGEVKAWSEPG